MASIKQGDPVHVGVIMTILITFGGTDPTFDLDDNGTFGDIADSAVEEVLRYQAPIQINNRRSTAATKAA